MSKRRSESARVVEFFKNESMDVADAILGIVRETVKGRRAEMVDPPGTLPPKRRPRRTKAEMATEGLVPTGHLQP